MKTVDVTSIKNTTQYTMVPRNRKQRRVYVGYLGVQTVIDNAVEETDNSFPQYSINYESDNIFFNEIIPVYYDHIDEKLNSEIYMISFKTAGMSNLHLFGDYNVIISLDRKSHTLKNVSELKNGDNVLTRMFDRTTGFFEIDEIKHVGTAEFNEYIKLTAEGKKLIPIGNENIAVYCEVDGKS